MIQRKIVEIDQKKCNGCGLCVPACAEGAIRIVNGKAQLVSETYCDGLGACLGNCPQDAIRIVHREAPPFDEEAVQRHLARQDVQSPPKQQCPGSMARSLDLNVVQPTSTPTAARESDAGLVNWPVQLQLVPPHAPFLREADVLLVADCVPVALSGFHNRFLGKDPVVIGCPKLDDAGVYVEKLARIITEANIRSLRVLRMEVPCCTGLVRIAQAAMKTAGRAVPLEEVVISIRGRMVPATP